MLNIGPYLGNDCFLHADMEDTGHIISDLTYLRQVRQRRMGTEELLRALLAENSRKAELLRSMQEFDKNSIIDGELAFDIAAVEVKAASERC